jgi:glycolate oxidase FAD binding subunit
MDLSGFAADVGSDDPVTIAGLSTRGGAVPGVRCVHAPGGVELAQPEEMVVRCGAGTPIAELAAALAEHGQRVALPDGGTVGGALAAGRSGLRRLGEGPLRDVLLQAWFVSAAGRVVMAGGPTVKNVSGFDLCRLLVGSSGTLGFLGSVLLRTRPIPPHEQWHRVDADPFALLRRLDRPQSVLWDGTTTWVLLAGHPRDVAAEAAALALEPVPGPPELPTGGRWSMPPAALATLPGTGRFVAEVGVGVVHHERPAPPRAIDPAIERLTRQLRQRFDPAGRLNPGVRIAGV